MPCLQARRSPLMEKLRNDFPQARFVFQSFPLPKLHPWAVRAASYLDCIPRSTTRIRPSPSLMPSMTHQKEIEDRRAQDRCRRQNHHRRCRRHRATCATTRSMAGADPAKTQTCAEAPATAERIKRSELLGSRIAVTGTPTLFINGRRIGNPTAAQYEALKTVVSLRGRTSYRRQVDCRFRSHQCPNET